MVMIPDLIDAAELDKPIPDRYQELGRIGSGAEGHAEDKVVASSAPWAGRAST